MSNKGNALISLLVLALGVVFLWLSDRTDFLQSVVTLCGLAFILPAVISLISMFVVSRRNRQSAGLRLIQMVCGIGGLGLGVCIILMPGTFRALLVYLFAALLIAGGAFQVFLVSHKGRPVNYPSWLLVAPILVLVAGVVMVCFESFHLAANEKWVVLVTGVAFVLFGINGLIISVIGHRGAGKGGASSAPSDGGVKPEPAARLKEGASSSAESSPVSVASGHDVSARYEMVRGDRNGATQSSGLSDRLDSEPASDVKRD